MDASRSFPPPGKRSARPISTHVNPRSRRKSEPLRPWRGGETCRAVRVDVTQAFVILAESGSEHEAGTKLVDARDLVGKGHAVRNPFGEPMDERLDFRDKAEHLLVDATALCIVVADGSLSNRHRASHIDLLHLVGLKELEGEARADRRQELGDDQFLGLKHPLRLAFSGRSAIQYNTVFNRDSFRN